MTTRRLFLAATALTAFSSSLSFAQTRPARIGILSSVPRDKSPSTAALIKALADLGYRDGGKMVIEFRSSDGFDERFAALARELIASKCDVIFALPAERTARALRDARTSIPVVFLAFEYDPVQRGMVERLSRPGGNMTGVYVPLGALTAKQLEIAQEVLPGTKRFLVLADGSSKDQLDELRNAAAMRGAELIVVEFSQRPYDLRAAMETGKRSGAEAVIGLLAAEFNVRRTELAALYFSNGFPSFVPAFMAAEPGILISYGPDFSQAYRKAAVTAIKIVQGAKPADIPIEQPDEFDLVVNLRTAKSLGVKIPYSVLARATKLIE